MSLVKDLKLNKLGMSHLLLLVAVFALIYGFNNYNGSKMALPYEGMEGSPYGDDTYNGESCNKCGSPEKPNGSGLCSKCTSGGSRSVAEDIGLNIKSSQDSAGGLVGTSLNDSSQKITGSMEDPGNLLPKNASANIKSIINDSVTKPFFQSKGRNIPLGNQLLRGELPNPKNVSCPWNNSTIEHVERPSICGSSAI